MSTRRCGFRVRVHVAGGPDVFEIQRSEQPRGEERHRHRRARRTCRRSVPFTEDLHEVSVRLLLSKIRGTPPVCQGRGSRSNERPRT